MSVNLFELFAGDKASEEDGRWVDLDENTAIKIRAIGSKAVMDLRDREMRPFQAILRAGGDIPEAKREEISLKTLAGGVIADWKGIKNAEGHEVAYSADEALAILKALPRFAAFVVTYSQDAQNYKDQLREDSAGN